MIRKIDSCALHRYMVTSNGAETRILTDGSSDWIGVMKYCIENKKYLIVTPCVNNGYNKADVPNDNEWIDLMHYMCKTMIHYGCRPFNSRTSLINEPMKWITKEHYGRLIDLAVPIIHSYGFKVGAGNEEFYTAQARGFMYQYILNLRKAAPSNRKFDILDVHIQGSCYNKEQTDMWMKEVLSWMDYWDIIADCPEAFYGNVTTAAGFELLKYQCNVAEEKLHCENFANVFNNLKTDMFPVLSDPKTAKKWYELCFNINGVQHSKYWPQWKQIQNSNTHVPNIKEDDMTLKPVYQNGMKYETGVNFIQLVLNEDIKPTPLLKMDGWWGPLTNPIVLQYQAKYNLNSYNGEVGPNTFQHMIRTYPVIWDRFNYLYMIGAIK